MFFRLSPAAPAIFATALLVGGVGCGPSEEEYQRKVGEIASLKGQLDAERAQSRKAKGELDEAQARVDALKKQLADAGIDVSNLNANQEQQARALEDYRRRTDQRDQAKKRFELLRDHLQPLAKQGVTVIARESRVVIRLPDDALFDAGRETMKKDGEQLLLQVAEVVRGDKALSARSFQIADHADDAPPKGGRIKDTWTLTAARAREVRSLLVKPQDKGGGGLDPAKWSAAGFGDTDPLKPNDTPENKQANRRSEIVLLPNADEALDLGSPAQAPSSR